MEICIKVLSLTLSGPLFLFLFSKTKSSVTSGSVEAPIIYHSIYKIVYISDKLTTQLETIANKSDDNFPF